MNKYMIILLVLLSGCATQLEIEYVYRTSQLICAEQTIKPNERIYPVIFVNAKTVDGKEVLGLDGENYSNLALNTRTGIEYIRSNAEFQYPRAGKSRCGAKVLYTNCTYGHVLQ